MAATDATTAPDAPQAPHATPGAGPMATRLAWAAAALLTAFLCLWPAVAGLVSCNDDLKFVRGPWIDMPLPDAVADAWRQPGMFRPMEIAVAAMCDPVSLRATPVIVVQALGYLAFLAAVAVLARRIAPRHPVVAPLAILWIGLSPATMTSLWQMDTCSQTWSAALAGWAGIALWRGVDAARAHRRDWGVFLALCILFLLGVNIKELFYGWSLGIGTALLLTLAWLWRRDRAAARAAWPMVIPVIALPILHLIVRLKFSGFSGAGTEHNRYAVALGDNLLLNTAVSFGGAFANGPLHLLGDDAAAPWLRVLPAISVVAAVCIVATAAGFRWFHRASEGPVRLAPLLLCGLAAILSMAATIPMGSVSELYAFGANAGAGLLVAGAFVMLWNPLADDERLLCRGIAVLGAAALAATGLDGVASRTHHFATTWETVRILNDRMIAHWQALPPAAREPAATIYFAKECYAGRAHSQYVISGFSGISPDETEAWMNHCDPQRQVILSMLDPLQPRPGIDLVLDCRDLPERGHW